MNWSFSVSSCNKRLLQKRIVCLNLVRIWYIFSHSHVCVKSRKRARNFFFLGGGGGWVSANKSLLDCESLG